MKQLRALSAKVFTPRLNDFPGHLGMELSAVGRLAEAEGLIRAAIRTGEMHVSGGGSKESLCH